ncbi:MAG: hypothetical protein KKI02_01070, partial [Planctomycetes bacterium]|nr:hypothetical protein [Planctomycetota bacterium]
AVALTSPLVRAHISDTAFMIQASNDAGVGSYVATYSDGVWDPDDQTFEWSLPGQVELVDETTQQWVATLLNATIFVRATQLMEIELNVGVISGESLTTFAIGSPLLTFSSAVPASFAQGRADASLTVTDGLGDGATLTGLGPVGSGAYRSYYDGYLDEGTRFSHLVGLISVGPGGSATGSQADPLVGCRPIGEDLYDASTEVAFTLTPVDLAYAVTRSRFPEPEPCYGDANGDGVVDLSDLSLVLAIFGTCEGDPLFDPAADLQPDGCIDVGDLVVLLAVYGQICW